MKNNCKSAFTLAEGATHVALLDNFRKSAFTLAEVLITIGIIGIVAAMTLPTIIKDTKNKEYAGARKKALATIGEAGKLLAVQGNIRYAENAKDFVKII